MSDYHEPHSYIVKTRKGYDARCYRTTVDPNRIGTIVSESSHRTQSAAIRAAQSFHRQFGGTIAID